MSVINPCVTRTGYYETNNFFLVHSALLDLLLVEPTGGQDVIITTLNLSEIIRQFTALGLRREYLDDSTGHIVWSFSKERLETIKTTERYLTSWFDTQWLESRTYIQQYYYEFFEDTTSEKCTKVINAINLAISGKVELTVNEDELDVVGMLLSVGMVRCSVDKQMTGKSVWKWIFAPLAQFKQGYQDIASQTRSRVHRTDAKVLNEDLKYTLFKHFSGDAYVESVQLSQCTTALAAFVKKYNRQVGARPFTLGLRESLLRQEKAEFCVLWEVANEVFTQSGGNEFLSDSIALLYSLYFRPRTPVQEWKVDEKEHKNYFSVCPLFSNKDLQTLYAVIPPKQDDEKAHGNWTSSAVPRKHQKSSTISFLGNAVGSVLSIFGRKASKRGRDDEVTYVEEDDTINLPKRARLENVNEGSPATVSGSQVPNRKYTVPDFSALYDEFNPISFSKPIATPQQSTPLFAPETQSHQVPKRVYYTPQPSQKSTLMQQQTPNIFNSAQQQQKGGQDLSWGHGKIGQTSQNDILTYRPAQQRDSAEQQRSELHQSRDMQWEFNASVQKSWAQPVPIHREPSQNQDTSDFYKEASAPPAPKYPSIYPPAYPWGPSR